MLLLALARVGLGPKAGSSLMRLRTSDSRSSGGSSDDRCATARLLPVRQVAKRRSPTETRGEGAGNREAADGYPVVEPSLTMTLTRHTVRSSLVVPRRRPLHPTRQTTGELNVPLEDDSIVWAIESIAQQSDGDLFPPIPEIDSIQDNSAFLVSELTKRFPGIQPLPSRRFIVPKGSLSYRQITQLHPQDTILLTSALYQFGRGIEVRRLPKDIVYSHRFDPGPRHELYGFKSYWTDFWTTAKHMSSSHACILICDIADFYNQVYHHTIENQLHESGFPNSITKWINNLLGSTTAGVSRGLPIGPHATHLIAECSLIPIDKSLRTHGINFIRYVDDFVVFSDSWTAHERRCL